MGLDGFHSLMTVSVSWHVTQVHRLTTHLRMWIQPEKSALWECMMPLLQYVARPFWISSFYIVANKVPFPSQMLKTFRICCSILFYYFSFWRIAGSWKRSVMHQAARIKQRLVKQLEKRNSHQHSQNRLVIIPLLAHISTLLDINEILLAKSRRGWELFAHNC